MLIREIEDKVKFEMFNYFPRRIKFKTKSDIVLFILKMELKIINYELLY